MPWAVIRENNRVKRGVFLYRLHHKAFKSEVPPLVFAKRAIFPPVAAGGLSCGTGKSMFQFILSHLKMTGIKRIILWGCVQADKNKAVNFYISTGFRTSGAFEYSGLNDDMIFEIT